MAITRTTHRQDLLANSRELRSGTLIAKAGPPHRVRKSSLSSSPVSKLLSNATLARRSRQHNARKFRSSDKPETQDSAESTVFEGGFVQSIDEAGQPLIQPPDGDHHQGEEDDLGPSSPLDGFNPPSPHLSVSSPIFRQSSPEVEGDGTSLSSPEQAEVMERDEKASSHLEDVGIPCDELWDQSEAYDLRCCFGHTEVEFLLQTPNRWMPAEDFDVSDAAAKLEAMYQQHLNGPSGFDPHSEHCQAGCKSTLFSQVHSVIDKQIINDKVCYLISWKVCWTPESCIGEKGWIPASLARNRNKRRRRSERLPKFFESRLEGYRKVMVVVNLGSGE